MKLNNLLDEMSSLATTHLKIVDDCTREINLLKYTIRNEFNLLSHKLFDQLESLHVEHKTNLNIFRKILRYNDIEVAVMCDEYMLLFMDTDISSKILSLNKELLQDTHDFQKDNNYAIIKELIKHNSLTLSTVALLCMKNYPDSSIEDIDFDKFIFSSNGDSMAVAKKIKNSSNNITNYDEMSYLHNAKLFSSLDFNALFALALSTYSQDFKTGCNIISQGNDADSLYIITSGEVEVIIDGKNINTLKDGDYFGEIAIISNIQRTATIKAKTDCSTLILSKSEFKELIYDNPRINSELTKEIALRLLQNSK